MDVGSVQWGDVPTWVAAVGTVSAVGVALVQVGRERKARLAQERRDRETQHLAHARLISAWSGTAEPVPEPERMPTSSPDDDSAYNYRTPIYIHNGSAEPVYELVIGIVFIQGAAPRTLEAVLDLREQRRNETAQLAATGVDVAKEQRAFAADPVMTVGMVPPGTWRVWIQGKGWTSIMAGRAGVDVAFTDRGGASWVRRATGKLDELNQGALDHFRDHGLYGPYEFQTPQQVD